MSPEPAYVSQADRGVIALLAVGSLAITGAACWYYTVERNQAAANVAQELTAVSDVQVKQIANWRRERVGDGRVLMANPVMNAAERVLEGAPNENDRADLTEISARMAREFLYSAAALVDLEGNVHLMGPVRMNAGEARELVHQAVDRHDVTLSDLAPEPDAAHPMMHLAIPIRGRGALILDIDPERFLYPYLNAWPGNSSTAESILVRREGDDLVYLSRRRNLPGAPLFAHRTVDHMAQRPASVQDAGWASSRPDYRGVPAFGTVRHIPDSPWYLICKIDTAEALRPVQRLELEMTLLLGLIVIAAGGAAAIIWRNRRTGLLRQREAWFRAVTNDTPAYLWMASLDEETSFLNQPLARFLGAPDPPRRGYWSAQIHPEDRQQARDAFHETFSARGEFNAEYRLRRWDGEYRLVRDRATPRFSSGGEFLGYAGALEDITGWRKAEQQSRDANVALAEELAERTRAEEEIHQLTARLIGAQEDERKRLARELHDDLNQRIAAVTIAMGNLKRGLHDSEALKAQGARIYDNLVRLSEGVRRLSHQLHPAALQYSGLAAALREYCGEFQVLTGINVALRIEGAVDEVSAEKALTVYRITQESLQNVAKHAKTKEAAIKLTLMNGVLRLTVSDDGVGLHPAVSGNAGLGLVSMKERARLVRGRLRVESGESGGTVVTLEIPAATE